MQTAANRDERFQRHRLRLKKSNGEEGGEKKNETINCD
jgi:hypothetical protein